MNKKETEFRHDISNNDWVIIAPGRAKRFGKKGDPAHAGDCPFCGLESQEKPVLVYSHGEKKEKSDLKDWTTVVIPNKYPLVIPSEKKEEKVKGIYRTTKAGGFHEVIVFRDHNKDLPQLSLSEFKEVIDCYVERTLEFKKHDFVKAVIVFHNRGREAGATQPHPHSQILGIPMIDKEFKAILGNAEKYYEDNGECLQCLINRTEKKEKERVVFENEDFICYVPFAPKFAFEVIVAPKRHSPRFEDMMEKEKKSLAEAMKKVLSKFYSGFDNPPYSFYLHTAPFNNDYSNFHWYFVLFPRINIWAGFELGANMEILTVFPEDQAEFLRKEK